MKKKLVVIICILFNCILNAEDTTQYRNEVLKDIIEFEKMISFVKDENTMKNLNIIKKYMNKPLKTNYEVDNIVLNYLDFKSYIINEILKVELEERIKEDRKNKSKNKSTLNK